ncbi:GTP cyclohydrolase II [Myxococcota bacterium]|nr:GTP cyclohydrolase II [Myxococcota bacterium]
MEEFAAGATRSNTPLVELVADARLPSRYGDFRVVGFRSWDGEDLGAVIRGDVNGAEGVPVRLHSECFTGDVMGSLRCDCRDQLEAALRFIGRAERGAVLYLPQEGRGIGLVNKIRAYALQDMGLDTVEANLALGFEDDLRRYDVAASMVQALGIRSVCLLTNNPKKIAGLRGFGVPVVGTLPVRMPPNEHNQRYLDTKRAKSGHLL